jgi:hypothetical protein
MLLPTAVRRRALCALGAGAMAIVLTQPASAAWTAPVFVSPAPRDAAEADVAVDADGDAVFAWERSDGVNVRIQARSRSAAGVLGPVQTLSLAGRDATEPDVAVDAEGDALIVWERSDGTNIRVQGRSRSAAGLLGPVQTLSLAGRDATRSRVVIAPDGDAFVVWQRPTAADQRVQGRARSAAGVLSAVQDLSPAGGVSHSPDVAIEFDGDVVATWIRVTFSGTPAQVAQTRARSAAGVLSAVQTVSGGGVASRPAIEVDPTSGDAIFAWEDAFSGDVHVQGRARSAAGSMGPILPLSPPRVDAFAPEVAVDSDGDAVFAWEATDATGTWIQARARAASGTISATQTLSDVGAADVEHDVDVDGDAVFTWERDVGGVARIQARTRSNAGTLGAVQTLSAAGAAAGEARVEVDATGDAVASWQRPHAGVVRIQAAAGP